MTPIKLSGFVTNSGSNGSAPGVQSPNIVAINSSTISPTSGFNLTIRGLSDEAQAQLKGGKIVTITIEDVG